MLKAGEVVSCPECKVEQFKFIEDVLPGTQIKDAKMESLGFDLASQRAGCFECGSLFVRKEPETGFTQVHTKDHLWVRLAKKPNAGHISIYRPR
jgi:hypothetical protein